MNFKNLQLLFCKCKSYFFSTVIIFFWGIYSYSQCTNNTDFGSAVAPNSGTTTISTCNYQTEYSTITSCVQGTTYQCNITSGGYITIRSGSPAGPVEDHGIAPLQWTASTNGTYYAHWNTDASCGQATDCVTTTITFISAATPCDASLPQSEPFSIGVLPPDWTSFFTSGDGWLFTGTPGYEAANNGRAAGTYAWIDFSGTDVNTVLETPEWCTGGEQQAELTYDFYADLGTNSISPLNILYVEAFDGVSWNIIQTNQENTSGWVNKNVIIDSYVNSNGEDVIKIRFRGESGGAGSDFYQDILLDNVNIVAYNPCTDPFTGYFILGAGTVCSPGSRTLTLSGSQSGVSYRVFRDGVAVSSWINGTGSSIFLGSYSVSGTYTVLASGNSGSSYCSGPFTLSSTATITVVESPTVSAGSNVSICSGGSTQLNGSVSGGASSLTTTFAGGNSSNGNMFDIQANENITIKDFDVHFTGTNGSFEVYYKNGSYIGSETNAAAWLLVGTATGINGAGTGVGTPLNLNLNLSLASGQTYAFYVTNSSGQTISYTNGTTAGSVFASNGDLTVFEGVGKTYPFGNTFSPRNFNGTIEYEYEPTYSWSPSAGLSSTSSLTPTASPTSTTTYTLTASNLGCSSSDNVDVTVEPQPILTYLLSGTTPICSGSSTSITLSGSQTNVSYQLLRNGTALNAPIPGTGSSLSFGSYSTAGTYSVLVYGVSGYCNGPSTLNSTFTLSINSPPTALTSLSGGGSVACGSSVTLTASGGNNGSGAVIEWFSGGCGSGLSIGTGSSITVSPQSNTTYYVRRRGTSACSNTTSCINTTVTVIANEPPTTTGDVICSGETGTVTASGAGLDEDYIWYSDAAGTNQIGSGSTYNTPALTGTTTYYAQIIQSGIYLQTTPTQNYNISTGNVFNFSSAKVSATGNATLTVFYRGDVDNISETINIFNENGTLVGTTLDAVNQCDINYESTTFTIPIADINSFASDGVISFELIPDASVGSFCVNNDMYCQLTYAFESCPSSLTSATITVNQPPTSPTSITGNNSITCGDQTILTISGGSNGSGSSYQWFEGSCGSGNIIGTGPSIAPSPTTTTTYYVRRVGTICPGTTACASITVIVNPISDPIVADETICPGETATLTASGAPTGGGYNWYSDALGSNLIGTEASYTTPNLNSTTTYYVSSYSAESNTYDQTIQISNPNLSSTNTFTFSGTPTGASGSGTLIIRALGDLDGTGTNLEQWSIDNEDGQNIGVIGGTGSAGDQCSNTLIESISLTSSQIDSWAANGSISFTADDLPGNINNTLCGNEFVEMQLTYDYSEILCSSNLTPVNVNVDQIPSLITTEDLTDASTCGLNELTIAHDGVSGSGTWEITGGDVVFQNSFSNDAQITLSPSPSSLGIPILATWIPSGACSASTIQKTIQYNQPNSIVNPDINSFLWGGLSDNNWEEGSNWYNWNGSMWIKQSNPPNNNDAKIYVNETDNLCITNNAPNVGNGTIGDLNIGTNANLSLGSETLSIHGNIVNNGALQNHTGTVQMIGSSNNQTISGNSFDLNNLVVDKANGTLNLSTPINILGNLTLNSDIDNGLNTLVLGSSSINTGSIESNGGVILGKLRRFFANSTDSKLFPIGIPGVLRDVNIEFPNESPGIDQYLTISYKSGVPTLNGTEGSYSGLPLSTSDGQLIQNYDEEGYWEVIPGSLLSGDDYTTSISSTNYNITIHMNDITGSGGSVDRNKVRIIKCSGPEYLSWQGIEHGTTPIGGNNLDNDFTVTASSNGFSFFGAGSDNGNALPVELISFGGDCSEGITKIVWQTASEYNSSYFELEKSRNNILWESIDLQEAAGYSNELITYTYSSSSSPEGVTYYRLSQFDFDGTEQVYDDRILDINCSSEQESKFVIFPNPNSGSFNALISNQHQGNGMITVIDAFGKEVYHQKIEISPGLNSFSISTDLPAGLYYIRYSDPFNASQTLKFTTR